MIADNETWINRACFVKINLYYVHSVLEGTWVLSYILALLAEHRCATPREFEMRWTGASQNAFN